MFNDVGVAETSAFIPTGLTLYGVALDVFSIVPPVDASAPVSFVVPAL